MPMPDVRCCRLFFPCRRRLLVDFSGLCIGAPAQAAPAKPHPSPRYSTTLASRFPRYYRPAPSSFLLRLPPTTICSPSLYHNHNRKGLLSAQHSPTKPVESVCPSILCLDIDQPTTLVVACPFVAVPIVLSHLSCEQPRLPLARPRSGATQTFLERGTTRTLAHLYLAA